MKKLILLIFLSTITAHAQFKHENKSHGWYSPTTIDHKITEEKLELCKVEFGERFVRSYSDGFDRYCLVKPEGREKEKLKEKDLIRTTSSKKCPNDFEEEMPGITCLKKTIDPCPADFKDSKDKEFCYRCENGGDLDYQEHVKMQCLGSYCADKFLCKVKK